MLSEANRLVEKRFSSFGCEEVRFQNVVQWSHSLDRDAIWPTNVHWTHVNYRNATRWGDVKYCWELNRHRCFGILGRAYRLTGDERYTRAFVDLLNSWCDQNPPETGIHYVSNLELGLRCVAWL